MLQCFISMLQKYIWMLHMLQWLYTYVASVYSKCFIHFGCMLQVFCLDVAYVVVTIYICCKHMFQMFHLLQMYVTESASILQMFHKHVQAQTVPTCMRAGNGATQTRSCSRPGRAGAIACACGAGRCSSMRGHPLSRVALFPILILSYPIPFKQSVNLSVLWFFLKPLI
jgi:hypothetical protein